MTTTKQAVKLETKTKKTTKLNNTNNQIDQNLYISGKELAKRWGISYRTVERWRFEGVGLPYIKIGDRIVRYSLDAVHSYERIYGPQLVMEMNWGLSW